MSRDSKRVGQPTGGGGPRKTLRANRLGRGRLFGCGSCRSRTGLAHALALAVVLVLAVPRTTLASCWAPSGEPCLCGADPWNPTWAWIAVAEVTQPSPAVADNPSAFVFGPPRLLELWPGPELIGTEAPRPSGPMVIPRQESTWAKRQPRTVQDEHFDRGDKVLLGWRKLPEGGAAAAENYEVLHRLDWRGRVGCERDCAFRITPEKAAQAMLADAYTCGAELAAAGYVEAGHFFDCDEDVSPAMEPLLSAFDLWCGADRWDGLLLTVLGATMLAAVMGLRRRRTNDRYAGEPGPEAD